MLLKSQNAGNIKATAFKYWKSITIRQDQRLPGWKALYMGQQDELQNLTFEQMYLFMSRKETEFDNLKYIKKKKKKKGMCFEAHHD